MFLEFILSTPIYKAVQATPDSTVLHSACNATTVWIIRQVNLRVLRNNAFTIIVNCYPRSLIDTVETTAFRIYEVVVLSQESQGNNGFHYHCELLP